MFKSKKISVKRTLLVLLLCLMTYSSTYAAGWRKVDDNIDIAYQDGTICYEYGWYLFGIKWASEIRCEQCCN